MSIAEKRGPGAPGIGAECEAEIIRLAGEGLTPSEIMERVPVKKTKVYEVLRVAKRIAPVADPPGPAATETDRCDLPEDSTRVAS